MFGPDGKGYKNGADKGKIQNNTVLGSIWNSAKMLTNMIDQAWWVSMASWRHENDDGCKRNSSLYCYRGCL